MTGPDGVVYEKDLGPDTLKMPYEEIIQISDALRQR